jgi:hypothetical protein
MPRIFAIVMYLSFDAIISDHECVTDDAIAKWTPVRGGMKTLGVGSRNREPEVSSTADIGGTIGGRVPFSWLSRLVAHNHCEVADSLVHIGIDAKYAAALDLEIDMTAAQRISAAARIDPEFVPAMAYTAMPEAELRLTAQVPFQACPNCADGGLELRHWRKAWAFDCQICSARLLPGAER